MKDFEYKLLYDYTQQFLEARQNKTLPDEVSGAYSGMKGIEHFIY